MCPARPWSQRRWKTPSSITAKFRYARVPVLEPDETGQQDETLELVVNFDSLPVLDLVRDADLPIWRSAREKVLVWVVVQDGPDRVLIGATPRTPLVAAFEARARDRGLPLALPLLDLEDQLAVDPAAVWGRLSQVIDPASVRYDADVLLLGRFIPDPTGGWLGEWEFWVDGAVVPFTTSGEELADHAPQAVDVLWR